MNSSVPMYREVQPYRELPPFTLLTGVGTLFGWFLIIWVALLERPLGALTLPSWLAWVIGLSFGVLLPLAYMRMRMVTEVYADRLLLNNGVSGRVVFPVADIAEIELRTGNIHEDYNVRNVGTIRSTRIAYTVTSTDGVQLVLVDGRQFLIGSKNPQELNEAVLKAWQDVHPNNVPTEIQIV